MPKRALFALTGLLLIGLVLGARAWLAPPASAVSTHCGVTPAQPANSLGIPAIAPTQPTCVPSYTVADVRAYFAGPNVNLGKVVARGTPAVASIAFVTSGDAARSASVDTGLPASAVVCLVRLTGSFSVAAPGNGAGQVAHTAVVIFDGTTGNLLVVGTPG